MYYPGTVKRLCAIIAMLQLSVLFVGAKTSVLILDGRNNHDWRITTDALRAGLEVTGCLKVTVTTAPESKIPEGPRTPKSVHPRVVTAFQKYSSTGQQLTKSTKDAQGERWKSWKPNFRAHDVVLLNYNGQNWPDESKTAFVEYMKNGGAVLLVHAANNAFRDWDEFNEMIGGSFVTVKSPITNPALLATDRMVKAFRSRILSFALPPHWSIRLV
jgi:hypothetical protein